MSVVEFGEPPMSQRDIKAERWRKVVEELKNNPNTWGKVGIYAPGIATALRKGLYRQFLEGKPEDMPPGEWMRLHWQVHALKVADHKKDEIWVRWLG